MRIPRKKKKRLQRLARLTPKQQRKIREQFKHCLPIVTVAMLAAAQAMKVIQLRQRLINQSLMKFPKFPIGRIVFNHTVEDENLPVRLHHTREADSLPQIPGKGTE